MFTFGLTLHLVPGGVSPALWGALLCFLLPAFDSEFLPAAVILASTSALSAFVGPVGLKRSPCSCFQREISDSGALCQLPVWDPCLLPPALPLSRCSPGPPLLPHLQAHLSYPSLGIGHQMGWSHLRGWGGCQGPSPRPLTAHSGVRPDIPAFGAETLQHRCHHQPGPLANNPPAFWILPPPPFSLSLQDQATNYLLSLFT